MSQLDIQALTTNFEAWRSERAADLSPGEAFERYCIELIFKDYDLSDEDIELGLLGGSDDGGIDGFYFFANGQLLTDEKAVPQPTMTADLYIIQTKNEAGYSEIAVQKMEDFANDLFDFSKPTKSITYYNQKVKDAIDRFRSQYEKIIGQPHELKISFIYGTRCDGQPNQKVKARGENLKAAVTSHVSSAVFSLDYWGAKEFVTAFRTPLSKTLVLEIVEHFMAPDGSVVCLSELSRFAAFLRDEKGKLRQYLLEPNVRDYQGEKNVVNQQIRETLKSPDAHEFWWLNNGITILADTCSVLPGPKIKIESPELVNGLQTSYEIFNYFDTHKVEDARMVLVRIILPPNDQSRRRIIKATNSQSPVDELSLRATDDIHFDIEELLKLYGIFYDRRKGEYRRLRKPVSQIVSMRAVAQAVIAVLLRRPNDARARPKSLLNNSAQYKSIFDDAVDRKLYAACVLLDRQVEKYLAGRNDLSRDVRNDIRYYMDAWLASVFTGSANPTIDEIVTILEPNVKIPIATNVLDDAATAVIKIYGTKGGDATAAKGSDMILEMQTQIQTSLTV